MANPEWTEPSDWGPDAADIALAIDALYEEATNNPCTCGSQPEDYCRFCGAWAKARRESEKLIREAMESSI